MKRLLIALLIFHALLVVSAIYNWPRTPPLASYEKATVDEILARPPREYPTNLLVWPICCAGGAIVTLILRRIKWTY